MFNLILAERSHNWQYGFQLPATPVMEGIINFHHDLFFFLVVIGVFVFYVLFKCLVSFNSETNKTSIVVTHAATLEIVWTILPALILIVIAIPSFSLLYSMEEIIQPLLTIKIIGHQWYWTYEFLDPNFILNSFFKTMNDSNGKNIFPELDNNLIFSYDSYMLADDSIQYRHQRLLRVDNKLYLPIQANIRLLITSADVLHSWAVPALGVKLDACPGRLNQTATFIYRPGHYYGQCSEICGVNHGFMPINVTALDVLGGFDYSYQENTETITTLFNYFLKNKFEG